LTDFRDKLRRDASGRLGLRLHHRQDRGQPKAKSSNRISPRKGQRCRIEISFLLPLSIPLYFRASDTEQVTC
jgi:hypothetical protein